MVMEKYETKTEIFQQWLNELKDYHAEYHSIPTYSYMMKMFSISKGSVSRFMQLLKSYDLMDIGPDDQLIPGKRFFDIPFTDDKVQAGEFTESFGQNGGYRSVPGIMIRKPSITRMMQIKGDSMIDLEIYDGDWALYEKRPMANVKDIVIALLEGANSYTIKELGKEGDNYILIPHNKAYEIIRPKTNFYIEGVLINTIKSSDARFALAS